MAGRTGRPWRQRGQPASLSLGDELCPIGIISARQHQHAHSACAMAMLQVFAWELLTTMTSCLSSMPVAMVKDFRGLSRSMSRMPSDALRMIRVVLETHQTVCEGDGA